MFYKRRENCWTTCPCVEIFLASCIRCGVCRCRPFSKIDSWVDRLERFFKNLFFDGGRKSSSLTAGAQLRRWHPLDMAVRRVTRLDRQNDKHLKRHKRRAELTFTSVPILLSLPEKKTHSGALVQPASNVWAFLIFFGNFCYFFFFLVCYCKEKIKVAQSLERPVQQWVLAT